MNTIDHEPSPRSPGGAEDDRCRGLRIALVYDCVFPGSIGGIERRNAELARALAERGHRVTLAGWNRSGAEERSAGRIRVVPLGSPVPLYDPAGRRRLAAALRFALHCLRLDVRRFDVVETAHVPYLHLVPLALKCVLARRPLVVSWYEFWGSYWKAYLGGWRWRAAARFEAGASRLGALATASSRLTLDRLAARRRGNPPRLLSCGIDLERIDAALAERRAAGPEASAPPLLYAGRLVREKRLDLLLEAVALLTPPAAPGGLLLRIVGHGPDRGRLESRAVELSLGGRVEFTGPLPSGEQVFAAMAGARVAVQPSAREGFGLFPLEAMAAGLPVVYCRSPESAVGEIVRDGLDGLAVDPDPGALAGALARLLGSEEERRRMAVSARRRAEAYSWPAIAAVAEALFREACGPVAARR